MAVEHLGSLFEVKKRTTGFKLVRELGVIPEIGWQVPVHEHGVSNPRMLRP